MRATLDEKEARLAERREEAAAAERRIFEASEEMWKLRAEHDATVAHLRGAAAEAERHAGEMGARLAKRDAEAEEASGGARRLTELLAAQTVESNSKAHEIAALQAAVLERDRALHEAELDRARLSTVLDEKHREVALAKAAQHEQVDRARQTAEEHNSKELALLEAAHRERLAAVEQEKALLQQQNASLVASIDMPDLYKAHDDLQKTCSVLRSDLEARKIERDENRRHMDVITRRYASLAQATDPGLVAAAEREHPIDAAPPPDSPATTPRQQQNLEPQPQPGRS
eukprot:Selendium_serpulae@DN4542_c0_g2_i1.p2